VWAGGHGDAGQAGLTLTRLPVVAGVQAAGHRGDAVVRHASSELDPVQLRGVCAATARVDEDQGVAVATSGLQGAGGHGHGEAQGHVEGAHVLLVGPAGRRINVTDTRGDETKWAP